MSSGKSSDGETFKIDKAVALESQTIKHIAEDVGANTKIPLPNVTDSILGKVIEYAKEVGDGKKQVGEGKDAVKEKVADFVESWKGHGTCTVAFVTPSGIYIGADGRTTSGLKHTEGFILTGSDRKVVHFSRYLVATLAGDASQGDDMLANVKLRFGGSLQSNNIHQVAMAFNNYMDGKERHRAQFGGKPITATIMVFGYHHGTPTMYNSDTRICERMQNWEIQGSGTGINFARNYLVSKLPSITSSTSEQEFIGIVGEAVAYATINDPHCGGEVSVASLARRMRPNIYCSGHAIRIICLRMMAGYFDGCLILHTSGMPYESNWESYMKGAVQSCFPTAHTSHVIAVCLPRIGSPEYKIVRVVRFGSAASRNAAMRALGYLQHGQIMAQFQFHHSFVTRALLPVQDVFYQLYRSISPGDH